MRSNSIRCLNLMRQPSLDHTGTDFLEAWYGFLLVAGNAYVEAVGVDGEIRELHNLRPDRMKVLPGLDGWPEGYEYTAGGKSVRFIDEPVAGVRPDFAYAVVSPGQRSLRHEPDRSGQPSRSIFTTRRRVGTRRCWIIRRGRAGRWFTRPQRPDDGRAVRAFEV